MSEKEGKNKKEKQAPKEPRTRKSTKFVFTLKNIKTDTIDQKYGISLVSNITALNSQPDNTTTIVELSDLNKDISLDIISFLDESKRIYQCTISMIDLKTGKNAGTLKYKCYWCRHSFSSAPIGCPIRYVSSKAIKTYHSEVTKDNYTIKENITKYKENLLSNTDLFNNKNKSNIIITKEEYYETDGVFCSFNCCKAFIGDNKHNILYDKSDNLLIKLYGDMNTISNLKNIKINPAPSWRLLKEYGGTLSIEEFRNNFNKALYDFHGVIKSQNLFKPIGMLYEEKINF